MGFFEFPHTRTYDTDLGWLIGQVIKLKRDLAEFINFNTIKYADPIAWNITTQYEGNTVVINPADGTAYISTQPVPSGVNITNTDYWTPIFNYGESMETLREQIAPINEGTSPTATQNIVKGTLFWWNGLLYRALYTFPAGTAFIEGTNVEQIDLVEWVNENIDSIITMMDAIVPTNEGTSPTATQNIVKGTLFWWNGLLYRALYTFPAGTAFIEGTNVEQIDLVEWITERVNRIIVDTCEEMRSADLSPGDEVITLGYHSVNDGGGGVYKIAQSPAGFSEALENGYYANLIDNGEPNSKQLGMWGDNIHDDTSAFTVALSYLASAGVKTLHMSDGLYKISGSHIIPYGKSIEGEGTPRIPTFQDNKWNMADRTGAVFAITGGEGTTTTDNSPFKMRSYTSLVNLGFWYPDQPVDGVVNPVLYPPTIALIPDPGEYDERNNNVLLDNITFGNAYLGISAECVHTCFTLKSSWFYAFKNVLTIDQSLDIDRICNVHINMMGVLYDQGFTSTSPRVWQYTSGVDNAGVIVRKADATLFEDLFIYGFKTAILIDGTVSGHVPNGITFRNCAAEGCVDCFKAEGVFNRIKLMFCSFGVNYTDGGEAIKIIGSYAGAGTEIYISDTTVWRSNDRCLYIRYCDDVVLNNIALKQMTVKGTQRAAGLLVDACRRVAGSNMTIQVFRNESYNAQFVYIVNSRGVMLNQINAFGLDGQTYASFIIDSGNHAVQLKNLITAHEANSFVSGSAVNSSADTPINYMA